MTIPEQIRAQEESFHLFIRDVVLSSESWKTLSIIASHDHVFILSGIIRDFLTGKFNGYRDFDCTVLNGYIKDRNILSYLRSTNRFINNLGGLKIRTKDETIDIWRLKDTWGLKKQQLAPIPSSLLDSVFFNFSSIIYDFNSQTFIFDDRFCEFLKTKQMDIVYGENPNIELCLVNIAYYFYKYNYSISNKLKNWIKQNYNSRMNFNAVQISHFGSILFKNENIHSFFQKITKTNYVQD